MSTAIPPSVPVTTATPPTAPAPAAETRSRTRRSWTATEKAECLALFRESGMSQSDFAREMKMSAATLSCWRQQERDGVAGTSDEDGPLIELSLPAPAASAPSVLGTVTIHLPGGVRLEVTAGTDVAWIGQLLGSLRPCSA